MSGEFRNQEKAKVSVAMPCYNSIRFIDATVLSVLSQSHQNWELLAYDDGSTDGTFERIKFWESQDPRIKAEQPFGANGHFVEISNAMIDDSEGDFYCQLDCDDAFLPTKIERQLQLLDGERALAAVAVGGLAYSIMDHEDGRIDQESWTKKHIDPYASYTVPVNDSLKTFNRVIHSTFFTRAESIKNTSGYEELVPVQDWDMMLQIAEKGDIYVVPEYQILKRRHGENLSKVAKPLLQEMIARLRTKHGLDISANPPS